MGGRLKRIGREGGLILAVVTIYSSVIITRYGFSDDYRLLYGFQRAPGSVARLEIGNARPGMLVLHWLGFGAVHSIGGLQWMRLVTVLGIGTVAVAVMRIAISTGRSPGVAAALGLVIGSLPTMQVTASWSLMFVVPPAMLLGLAAGRWADIGRPVLGAVALSVALVIYQPGAMCYWLFIALASTGPHRQPWTRERALRHLPVLATGVVVAATAWLAGRGNQQVAGRSHLATDPLEQSRWFLQDVLPRALSVAPIHTPAVILALLPMMLLAGLVLAERRAGPVLGLLALLPASYATSLSVAADWPTMRSMTALAPVAIVLYLRAVDGYGAMLRRQFRIAPAIGMAGAAVVGVAAAHSAFVYFARPQHAELRAVERAVAAKGLKPGQPVGVAQVPWTLYLAPATSWDEFGQLSTTTPWAPVPMVRLIRHAQTGSWAGVVWLASEPGPGVLDLPDAIRGERALLRAAK